MRIHTQAVVTVSCDVHMKYCAVQNFGMFGGLQPNPLKVYAPKFCILTVQSNQSANVILSKCFWVAIHQNFQQPKVCANV